MNLYTVETGLFKLDGGAMFGVVPKTIWQKTNPADDQNLCPLAMRCLLVEEGDRLILIDTGIGNKQDSKFLGYYYLHGEDTLEKSLAKLNFSKDDITDVFLTHLHLDHCGGAVDIENETLVPAFKNAIYWSNKKHWEWATHPNDREKASFLKENILPIAESGKLKFVPEEDLYHFSEHIKIQFSYGHTEAMMIPHITYKGKTIVYVADLIPTVGHIPVPYIPAYDMFPLKSLKEKKDFLENAHANNYILFFEHDAQNECCTLQSTAKGIRLADTFFLNGI